jgi:hypothetical protein
MGNNENTRRNCNGASNFNDFISEVHARDLKFTEIFAKISAQQEDLTSRLFGGVGQVGAIPYMIQTTKEQHAKMEERVDKIEVRAGSLETWRTGSKRWVAGALAVLTLEGTALGLYFSKIAAHVNNLQSLHK